MENPIIEQKIRNIILKKNFQKTKIVATIGPASNSEEMLTELIAIGVDVCRLNFSHGAHADHQKVIDTIHHINKKHKTYIGMLADLQGPKIRLGEVENGGVDVADNAEIIITTIKCVGNAQRVYLSYQQFPQDVKPGEKLMLDDGKLLFEVVSSNQKDEVKCKILHGGKMLSKKGVNLPNTKVSIPCITEKDKEDIAFILENKMQWIALSFVRSAADVLELRAMLNKSKQGKKIGIIAKIEKPEALNDIDNIIAAADAIMVARGDLGVEVPLHQLPLIQKMLVKKCNQASKPVIIATQMLESMITNIMPTRAEVNDIANSVMDGADALMLSAETSTGAFPAKAVEYMTKVIAYIENYENIYQKHNVPQNTDNNRYITDSICYHACNLAQQVGALGIVTMTHSGYSAFKISSFRPKAGIFVFTHNHSLLSKLSLVWGVRSFYYDKFNSTDQTIEDVKMFLAKEGFLVAGDLLINVASTPIDEKGKINMLKLSQI